MGKAGTGRRLIIAIHSYLSEVGERNTAQIQAYLLEYYGKNHHDSLSNLGQTMQKSPLIRKTGEVKAKSILGTTRSLKMWEAVDWNEQVEIMALKIVNGTHLMRYESLPKLFLNDANELAEEIQRSFEIC